MGRYTFLYQMCPLEGCTFSCWLLEEVQELSRRQEVLEVSQVQGELEAQAWVELELEPLQELEEKERVVWGEQREQQEQVLLQGVQELEAWEELVALQQLVQVEQFLPEEQPRETPKRMSSMLMQHSLDLLSSGYSEESLGCAARQGR